MISLVNAHTNVTSKRWHVWEIDLRFALNSNPGWSSATSSDCPNGQNTSSSKWFGGPAACHGSLNSLFQVALCQHTQSSSRPDAGTNTQKRSGNVRTRRLWPFGNAISHFDASAIAPRDARGPPSLPQGRRTAWSEIFSSMPLGSCSIMVYTWRARSSAGSVNPGSSIGATWTKVAILTAATTSTVF